MRLIDADALIDDLMVRYCKECNKRRGIKNGKYRIIYEIGEAPCRACEVDDVKAELEEAPTADHIKHGKWVRVTDGGDFEQMCCSECGRVVYSTYGSRLAGIKYCQYCGVRFDDEEQKKDIVAKRTDGCAVWDDIENWR